MTTPNGLESTTALREGKLESEREGESESERERLL